MNHELNMQIKNNPPEKFKKGVRVLMLINRGIASSNKGSKRWVNKIITTSPYEYDNAMDFLLEQQKKFEDDVRVYACVNARNMDKAIQSFQHKQIDIQPENKNYFYSHINDSFCSCLMKPENKAERLFLVDIDNTDMEQRTRWQISNRDIRVHLGYPSYKGYHLIIDPCHPERVAGFADYEIKKDALLLIN